MAASDMARIIKTASSRHELVLEAKNFASLHELCLSHPGLNRIAQLAQPTFEEVVGAFNNDQLFRFRHCSGERLQLRFWTELVTGSADEQLGLAAIVQKLEAVDAWIFFLCGNRRNRNSHSDHALHSRVQASGVHADRRAKRESGEDER